MDTESLSKLASSLGGTLTDIRKSTIISVDHASAKSACKAVSEISGMNHLSTITGVDEGESISIYYHFWKGSEFLTVKTSVPKTEPRLESISDALPSALLYEAEVKDLLGVDFEGNQFMGRKLLLPDNYPSEAPPPLRKEANPETIRKMMGLE